MSKYTFEQKLDAMLKITEQHMTITEVSKELGASYEHVRRWLKHYKMSGVDGLNPRNNVKYSGEFKLSVLQYMQTNHLSLMSTAVEFDIPTDELIARWLRKYNKEGPQAFFKEERGKINSMKSDNKKKPSDNEQDVDLVAEVQRLRMENAYLKKLRALVQERTDRENGKKQPPSTN